MRLRLFVSPAPLICTLCMIARWRDNMPKRHWPFSLLTRFQQRPGVIPARLECANPLLEVRHLD